MNLGPSGILVIDKPSGMTSHDVVNRVRRKLKTRRVGHAGTLDPDATGLLVLCVGDSTRLLEFLAANDKAYEGTVVFGVSTDTDDASGKVLEQKSARRLDEASVRETASFLTGTITQRPPAFSAIHVSGRRAYDLARSGEEVVLPERQVEVALLELRHFAAGELAQADFFVSCSKGTYIRSLCRDWGHHVGLPAHMGSLRRTRFGEFTLDDAWPLEIWERLSDSAVHTLLPPERAVLGMPTVSLPDELIWRLANGQAIRMAHRAIQAELVVVTDGDGILVAIANASMAENGVVLRPRKVFWKREP